MEAEDPSEHRPQGPGRKAPDRASALRFDPAVDRGPRLVAGGEGQLAREIIAIAEAHGRPVVSDPALAGLLSELPPGREVPENLYRTLAGLFAMVYRLEASGGRSERRSGGAS